MVPHFLDRRARGRARWAHLLQRCAVDAVLEEGRCVLRVPGLPTRVAV
jgi:hypothetical protein